MGDFSCDRARYAILNSRPSGKPDAKPNFPDALQVGARPGMVRVPETSGNLPLDCPRAHVVGPDQAASQRAEGVNVVFTLVRAALRA